jgi:perosamine synthetase
MLHVWEPVLDGNETAYVMAALTARRLSADAHVSQFEAAFAELAGCAWGVAVSSGTTALHLMLAALGIGPGDEVILPALTFVATANAVRYCGATPVLADIDPDTWCIDPEQVLQCSGPRTKAVLAVHLYGQPADMLQLQTLCDATGWLLLEDAAEAPGARLAGQPVGGFGAAAAFSFYANKTITTGEGGMVTTSDDRLVERLRLLRGQGQDPKRRYWHTEVGYNYRMSELQGALGLAQVEQIDKRLYEARLLARTYRAYPQTTWRWQHSYRRAEPSFWANVALLPEGVNRDAVAQELLAQGIETRPAFYPLHLLPAYQGYGAPGDYPVAERVGRQGLVLPSHSLVTDVDAWRVCETLERVCQAQAVLV